MSEENKSENGEKIPHFVNDPVINAATAPELKLYRPNINYPKAVLYVLIHFAAGFFIAAVWTWIGHGTASDIAKHMLVSVPLLFLITLRFTMIWFVKLYQRYAKSEIRLRCCMTPSCSQYSILALKKYGAVWGGIKTWKRLHRCNPPGGIDYP